jgi:hypothetical protein
MPNPFLNTYEGRQFLEMLGLGDYLKKRYPEPKEPSYPSADITPGQEANILKAMEEAIQGNVLEGIGGVRTSMGSRGTFRSGLRQKLEKDVRVGGTKAFQSALASYYNQKAGRLSNWNMGKAQFELSKYLPQLQNLYQERSGAGSLLGQFYR